MNYRQTIHQGTDDPIDITVRDQGTALSVAAMDAITRWVFEFGGETVDSDTEPTLFTKTSSTANLVIRPGSALTSAVVGEGYATLTFYDATNTNGVTVFSECTKRRLWLTVCA